MMSTEDLVGLALWTSQSNEGLRRGVSNLTVLTRLPDTIQQAVCNRNIRIDNAIYGGWETTGDW